METDDIITYSVDHRDMITAVGENWDRFALANAGGTATSAHVLHKPLWDFISDPTTIELYQTILKQVRRGQSFRFTLRCDSPSCRRLLEMRLESRPGKAVFFHSRTLSLTERTAQLLLDPGEGRSNELIRRCSWCNKVAVGPSWLELEDAIVQKHIFHKPSLPDITHVICKPCFNHLKDILTEPPKENTQTRP